jgi:hypothetical protein
MNTRLKNYSKQAGFVFNKNGVSSSDEYAIERFAEFIANECSFENWQKNQDAIVFDYSQKIDELTALKNAESAKSYEPQNKR